MQQRNADRDALNAEKAKLLGMIVVGKITAAEAAARLQEVQGRVAPHAHRNKKGPT